MMEIKFKYDHFCEYYLKVYSTIHITGTGIWEVNELELLDEYLTSELTLDHFIMKYFYEDLEINPSSVEFDKDDIKKLTNFIKNYESKNN